MSIFKIAAKGDDAEIVRGEFDDLQAAVEAAQIIAREEGIELEVVHTETETAAAVVSPTTEGNFAPWHRVETPKFATPHLLQWRPAYSRKRVGAVVYRSLTAKAWMVLDTRTGGRRVVATTAEAREITNAMSKEGYSIPADVQEVAPVEVEVEAEASAPAEVEATA